MYNVETRKQLQNLYCLLYKTPKVNKIHSKLFVLKTKWKPYKFIYFIRFLFFKFSGRQNIICINFFTFFIKPIKDQ